MAITFEHPANGYREKIGWLTAFWTLLFGPIYLAVRGLWPHVLVWLAIVVISFALGGPLLGYIAGAICTFCYACATPELLYRQYQRAGWKEVPNR